jgi:hypothetical protein
LGDLLGGYTNDSGSAIANNAITDNNPAIPGNNWFDPISSNGNPDNIAIAFTPTDIGLNNTTGNLGDRFGGYTNGSGSAVINNTPYDIANGDPLDSSDLVFQDILATNPESNNKLIDSLDKLAADQDPTLLAQLFNNAKPIGGGAGGTKIPDLNKSGANALGSSVRAGGNRSNGADDVSKIGVRAVQNFTNTLRNNGSPTAPIGEGVVKGIGNIGISTNKPISNNKIDKDFASTIKTMDMLDRVLSGIPTTSTRFPGSNASPSDAVKVMQDFAKFGNSGAPNPNANNSQSGSSANIPLIAGVGAGTLPLVSGGGSLTALSQAAALVNPAALFAGTFGTAFTAFTPPVGVDSDKPGKSIFQITMIPDGEIGGAASGFLGDNTANRHVDTKPGFSPNDINARPSDIQLPNTKIETIPQQGGFDPNNINFGQDIGKVLGGQTIADKWPEAQSPLFLNADTESGLDIVNRPNMPVQTLTDSQGRDVKVYGQAGNSSSTTPGHGETMDALVQSKAPTGDYEYFTLQRSLRTATDRTSSNGRIPDVIGVRRDGKVDVWEVKSKTDTDDDLQFRLDQIKNSLPAERQGNFDIIPPQYCSVKPGSW